MKAHFFVCLFLAVNFSAAGQLADIRVFEGSYKGFVVTNKLDTVNGKIVLQEKEDIRHLQTFVRFLTVYNNQYLFRPGEIKQFGLFLGKDTLLFESLNNDFNGEVVIKGLLTTGNAVRANAFFAQKLVNGYCNLYYMRKIRMQGVQRRVNTLTYNTPGPDFRDDDGQVVKSENGLNGVEQDYFCIKKETGTVKVVDPEGNGDFFADCIELMKKIYSHQYTYNDMPQIVLEYNSCLKQRALPQIKY